MASSPLFISKLLSPGTVALDLVAPRREDIFKELIARIPGIAAKPEARGMLLKAVLDREQMHSTGMGDGLAIPHARNAIPGLIERAVIIFGRHAQGLAYGAIDNAPVRLLFLLIAPNITEHLHIMARLSRLLRDRPLRAELLQAASAEQVIQIIAAAEERTGMVR